MEENDIEMGTILLYGADASQLRESLSPQVRKRRSSGLGVEKQYRPVVMMKLQLMLMSVLMFCIAGNLCCCCFLFAVIVAEALALDTSEERGRRRGCFNKY